MSGHIRVGIGLSPDLIRLDRPRMLDLVARINASAIDHVVVTDHVAFRGGRGQDGLAAMHYLAGLGIERELHTGVLILPLRHPTLVARQLIDLADIHEHGVVAAVGLGGDDPEEFTMVGMQASVRGKRMTESVERLVQLLAEQDEIEHDGGFYPVAGPGLSRGSGGRVKVLVGGRADAAFQRAAVADGWLATFCSPNRFAEGAAQLRTLRPAATLGYQAWVGFGPTGRAAADAQIRRFYDLDPKPFHRYIPVGGVDEVTEHLTPYVQVGARLLNLFPAGDHTEIAVEGLSAVAEHLHSMGEAA